MSEIILLDTVTQVHRYLGLESPKHPLVSVVWLNDLLKHIDSSHIRFSTNLYIISLKSGISGTCRYGRNTYDYQEGSIIFIAPGQIFLFDKDDELPRGEDSWILLFHPNLIRKSELGRNIDSYTFFNYEASESLHLSMEEKKSLKEIISKIVMEYSQNIDRHSQKLIISNIQLLLDYCTRFYDRQFYTRTNLNSDIISKFERYLKNYYNSDYHVELGIPSVAYCGKELGISPYYLSDLLKKETGRNALEHIHLFIIERAKTILLNSNKSVSRIAYELGFDYPQHFSRVFKNKTGMSPRKYRVTT